MGLLPGGHLLIIRGIQMESTVENLEYMESSEPGDSDKGSRLEAPKIGATEWDLAEQGAGETPVTGVEHPTPSNPRSENLEGLAEKVGTRGLRATSKNRCSAAKKRARKARLPEAPSGDWRWPIPVCSWRQVILCRSMEHLGSSGANPRRVGGFQRAQASDSGRPGALPRGEG